MPIVRGSGKLSQRCENCGRPLLKSDLKCFHCGAPAPGREPVPQTRPEDEQSVDLKAAARYGAMLLGLLALGAVLMNWMGASFSSPLNATPTPAPPAGWREFLSPKEDFLLWLPDSWHVTTPGNPNWETSLMQMQHPFPFSFRATEPASVFERVRLVARSTAGEGERPLMASVGLHPGLANANLEAMQEERWMVESRSVDTSGGMSVMLNSAGELVLIAELVYTIGSTRDVLHTLTMVRKTERGAFAITVSALELDMLRQEGTLWTLLDSFRPLTP